MLLSGEKHYDGCLGGKTGYTTTAGNTLVTFAERDNMRLVCVVLADTLRFQYSDTASLFDYGFGNFHKEVITENQPETTVQLLPLAGCVFAENDNSRISLLRGKRQLRNPAK